jgi:3-deoxy-D-manno-octulosonate 8-phosphate phosphatase (KDO 8-P phosphatase)
MTAEAIRDRMRRVRLVLLDVDGVLTDGGLRFGPRGDEGRRFHVRDGTAIKLALSAGLPVGILSGRRAEAVRHRAEELGLPEIHQGRREKLAAWREILDRRDLADADVAFMGDDVLDLPLLRRAGLAACPSDASAECLDAAHWVATRAGGAGCVRELLEAVLRAQDAWDDAVAREIGEPAPRGREA